ncbi:MAG: ABC transporter permease [Anaerolineae bacterium]|nr:ABC transporter permease [Anaerolineae bacterium]NUQ04221.1 ABC transporter permease [Anaerolineae bacterium]
MTDQRTSSTPAPPRPKSSILSSLGRLAAGNRRALFPLLALVLILLGNWLISPSFFSIRVVEGRMLGSIIDIFNRGAPTVLLAIGMTLVIATKGIDLSVGAVIAICGAVAAVLISTTDLSPYVVMLLSVGAGILCGLWNGILVAIFDIQPFIATLILMVVGRGIAQLITEGQIAVFNNPTLEFIGKGTLFGIPFAIILTAIVFVIVYLFIRRTALGLLIESVGANARASYYAGINARLITLMVYVISGICAAIAGLIITTDIKGADANNAGLWLELDAILAVVIGGTLLSGGRFYLALSVIGALIIQSIQTGIFVSGLPPTFNLIVQAVVILAILFLQSEEFRRPFVRAWNRMRKTA